MGFTVRFIPSAGRFERPRSNDRPSVSVSDCPLLREAPGAERCGQMSSDDRTAMGDSGRRERAPWSTVVAVAIVLFVAQVLPSPFRRHPAFRRFGPDKLLHFLGYAGFAMALADALADRLAAIRLNSLVKTW